MHRKAFTFSDTRIGIQFTPYKNSARVTHVIPHTDAWKQGVAVGDVLVGLNNIEITSDVEELAEDLWHLPRPIEITLQRDWPWIYDGHTPFQQRLFRPLETTPPPIAQAVPARPTRPVPARAVPARPTKAVRFL